MVMLKVVVFVPLVDEGNYNVKVACKIKHTIGLCYTAYIIPGMHLEFSEGGG